MALDDEGIETLLRRARPRPDAEWRADMELRLFGPPPRRRTRPAFAGLAAAGALALTAIAFALAGVGPLDRGSDVRATDVCHWVTVVKRERQPLMVVDAQGRLEVEYRLVPVRRAVKRCD